ncbi:hypothetical protein J6590_055665 [Homalodisca vitripennis]|nr:hypothetical protein J6590_055665 [Homalodisca vitripennis]
MTSVIDTRMINRVTVECSDDRERARASLPGIAEFNDEITTLPFDQRIHACLKRTRNVLQNHRLRTSPQRSGSHYRGEGGGGRPCTKVVHFRSESPPADITLLVRQREQLFTSLPLSASHALYVELEGMELVFSIASSDYKNVFKDILPH